MALTHGPLHGKEGVLARIHDQCLTSEVFGSKRCDCKEQLGMALDRVGARSVLGQGLAWRAVVLVVSLGTSFLRLCTYINRRIPYQIDPGGGRCGDLPAAGRARHRAGQQGMWRFHQGIVDM